MATNIVTNFQLMPNFKKSQYFRVNLGLVATIDSGGRREINTKDGFAVFYNGVYKTQIYAQGNIGDIKFYADFQIKDNSIAVYFGPSYEEFVFKYDSSIVEEKGIDFYIGHLLKSVEESYEERRKKEELRKMEPVAVGDPNKVFTNPGNVTYADLKAYLETKQKNRFKNNNSQT